MSVVSGRVRTSPPLLHRLALPIYSLPNELTVQGYAVYCTYMQGHRVSSPSCKLYGYLNVPKDAHRCG